MIHSVSVCGIVALPNFLRKLTLSRNFVQDEVTYPLTLCASRLKTIRRLESELESNSETKKHIEFSKKISASENVLRYAPQISSKIDVNISDMSDI
jgi:hypothetical protein